MVETKEEPKVTEESSSVRKERPQHPSEPRDFKRGDVVAITQYARVEDNYGGNRLRVKNLDTNMPFEVNGSSLVATLHSADQIHEEVEMTKTELAQLLVTLYGRPFTVVFKKVGGEMRRLRGRLIEPEPLLGRSHVEDLDIDDPKNRLRLVDHRTIESIIVNGVQFSLKGRK